MKTPPTPDAVSDQYLAIATGDLGIARRAVSLDWHNREADDGEAPAARRGGPIGLAVTAAWLRSAFSDISFEEIERLTDGDVVISRVIFSARQTGPLVLFKDNRAATVFPPTGRTFAVEQIHRHELRNGEVISHLARRDDLGMMEQLGHLPPTPGSMFRMLTWRLTGRSRRAEVDAAAIGEQAAALMADRLAHETSIAQGKPGP
jgi:hypothetical protein